MPESSLPSRLAEVADLAGDGFEPPATAVFAARRRQRYRTIAAAAGAVATVVAVVLAVTLIGRTRSSSSAPAVHVPPPPGHVSVAQLENYRWRALPDAPIRPREYGVVGVWTGSHLIVWGGSSGDQAFADGASYDPATRSWQKLPPAPLAPRSSPAFAWTGDELFVWGGATASGDASRTDGAVYDPARGAWHRLPPLSVGGDVFAAAVWTGSRVVLFTARADWHGVRIVTVHAYDPSADSWTTLPSIHTTADLLDLSALVAGDRIYVWMPVQTVAHGGLTTGNEGYVYRPRTNSWAPTDLLPTQRQYSVGSAVWTGDHIIFEPNGLECSCGGIPGASTGSWADPRTGSVRPIPGPDPFEGATFTWTGAAVLSTSGRATAAWDPRTDHWTKLRRSPHVTAGVQIWTGTRLLAWGPSVGLEFGPSR